jgi:hypothetical protein
LTDYRAIPTLVKKKSQKLYRLFTEERANCREKIGPSIYRVRPRKNCVGGKLLAGNRLGIKIHQFAQRVARFV